MCAKLTTHLYKLKYDYLIEEKYKITDVKIVNLLLTSMKTDTVSTDLPSYYLEDRILERFIVQKTKAHNRVIKALKLDKEKSLLYFVLFNSSPEDVVEVLQWFYPYLNTVLARFNYSRHTYGNLAVEENTTKGLVIFDSNHFSLSEVNQKYTIKENKTSVKRRVKEKEILTDKDSNLTDMFFYYAIKRPGEYLEDVLAMFTRMIDIKDPYEIERIIRPAIWRLSNTNNLDVYTDGKVVRTIVRERR